MALLWHRKQQNMPESFTGEGRSAAPFCHRLWHRHHANGPPTPSPAPADGTVTPSPVSLNGPGTPSPGDVSPATMALLAGRFPLIFRHPDGSLSTRHNAFTKGDPKAVRCHRCVSTILPYPQQPVDQQHPRKLQAAQPDDAFHDRHNSFSPFIGNGIPAQVAGNRVTEFLSCQEE